MARTAKTRFGERFDSYLISTDLPDETLVAIEAAYTAADQLAVDAANLANQNPENLMNYVTGALAAQSGAN
ncbi:hypothetical protein [Devosia sp. CAU 1758]